MYNDDGLTDEQRKALAIEGVPGNNKEPQLRDLGAMTAGERESFNKWQDIAAGNWRDDEVDKSIDASQESTDGQQETNLSTGDIVIDQDLLDAAVAEAKATEQSQDQVWQRGDGQDQDQVTRPDVNDGAPESIDAAAQQEIAIAKAGAAKQSIFMQSATLEHLQNRFGRDQVESLEQTNDELRAYEDTADKARKISFNQDDPEAVDALTGANRADSDYSNMGKTVQANGLSQLLQDADQGSRIDVVKHFDNDEHNNELTR